MGLSGFLVPALGSFLGSLFVSFFESGVAVALGTAFAAGIEICENCDVSCLNTVSPSVSAPLASRRKAAVLAGLIARIIAATRK